MRSVRPDADAATANWQCSRRWNGARGLKFAPRSSCVREDNEASRWIIESNGGVLEGVFRVRKRSEPLRRYWIDLRRLQ
jgi:hypothetical protein